MTTFKPQTRQQQIDALEKDWAENPRWDGVTRPYTAEEVINLRGSFAPENTIAQKGADRLWDLVNGSSKKRVCELSWCADWWTSSPASKSRN